MPMIEVDFYVWQRLTAMRECEAETENGVLRRLLNLGTAEEPEIASAEISADDMTMLSRDDSGFYSRGLFMPNGTLLRAVYKRKPYAGKIENGQWVDPLGATHTSPSAAAKAITHTSVNGLRFWEALLPGKRNWCRLDTLPMS